MWSTDRRRRPAATTAPGPSGASTRTPVNPRQVVHNEEHGARRDLVGPEGAASTVDQLAGVLQPAAGRDVRHALRARSATRSRSPPGPATRPGTTTNGVLRHGPHRGLLERSTRRPSQRSARPTAARGRRGSRSRPTSRAWARSKGPTAANRERVGPALDAPPALRRLGVAPQPVPPGNWSSVSFTVLVTPDWLLSLTVTVWPGFRLARRRAELG